jgi:hypothetical protein
MPPYHVLRDPPSPRHDIATLMHLNENVKLVAWTPEAFLNRA